MSHIQTKTPAEFEENFRQYGAQGYAMIIGHGFEFTDAAARVAPEYPRSNYVITSGERAVGANVSGIHFNFDEASYVAGMVAGAVTKSGVIATLGGTELPPVKASFDAFAAGARAVRPDVKVLTSFVGNWDDVSAGKEQALAQIGRGADVIFQNADAAGLGVFQAARATTGKKIRVIGSNADQNGVAPDVTLGSVVIDLPHAFLLVAKEIKSGSFKPRVVSLGTAAQVVRWVPNPQLASEIPAATAQAADSVVALQKVGKGPKEAPGVAP